MVVMVRQQAYSVKLAFRRSNSTVDIVTVCEMMGVMQ
jgi:hypothetical protein